MAGGVLTIAGLDPSGGAGLLADIKVFERFQITGFAVATALTFQNEDAGLGLEWTAWDVIKKQLEPLFDSYEI
ncbi:MAG: bifunctional hydroxymethylpyrimidine kinase/phosphomethylpyrimidine kinase, partial [Bacteroidota bacterium]